jgi:chemotaxis response regulator CheB
MDQGALCTLVGEDPQPLRLAHLPTHEVSRASSLQIGHDMAAEDSSNSGSSVSVPKGEVPKFPIVGVGASAGGLEAFRHLLQLLPRDLGVAFVLIPHLAPEHRSMMAEILARETPMPVLEVHDEPVIEPNKVYVIPPNRTMLLVDRHLKLIPAEEPRSHPDRLILSSVRWPTIRAIMQSA